MGKFMVKFTIVSRGIFLRTVSFWSTCFLKQISTIFTKSLQGVTGPPLVLAEM